MKPDTSRWRDSRTYDYFDDLSVEGLAWECLRRDPSYQQAFRALAEAGKEVEPLSREVEQRWGLRFRSSPFDIGRDAARPLVAAGQSCRHRAGSHAVRSAGRIYQPGRECRRA